MMINKERLLSCLNDRYLAISPRAMDDAETRKERSAICRGIDLAMNIVKDYISDEKSTDSLVMSLREWASQMGLPGRRVLVTEAADRLESLIEAQEARHALEVHNIGNVDIPDGVTEEQFYAVMNNVVEALEHTDKGESWPYDQDGDSV